MGERALVTGGAGFIGTHLCRRLLNEGFGVICLDNLMTGRRENIERLLGEPAFTFIHGDITKPFTVEGSLQYVLHLASPASPRHYADQSIHILKVGSLGTYHALGLAKAKGATFVLASTSEVYGDPAVHPQPEEYFGNVNPVGPRSIYAEAKRFAEAMTMAYHRQHGVDVRIARIFNSYGPGMQPDDGRVIPNFIVQALEGGPITIYGDGSQTRSLCYVDDLIEGLYRLMTVEIGPMDQAAADRTCIVNLGSPSEITILHLAQEVLRQAESTCDIVFRPLPPEDPKFRCPRIDRARALLGWEPRISLAQGLGATAAYFRGLLTTESSC